MTLKEQMEYVVSAISEIGPVIARNLLKHFQTIENIAKADESQLMEVPKVGKKIAKRIVTLMKTPYDKADEIDI
jgi:Fanconi anemia group M protein